MDNQGLSSMTIERATAGAEDAICLVELLAGFFAGGVRSFTGAPLSGEGGGMRRLLILLLSLVLAASVGCRTGPTPTTRPSIVPTALSPTTAPATTLTIPTAELKEVDLSAALLTLEDLPDGREFILKTSTTWPPECPESSCAGRMSGAN